MSKDNVIFNLRPSITNSTVREEVTLFVDDIFDMYSMKMSGLMNTDATYHIELEKELLRSLILVSLYRPERDRNLRAFVKMLLGNIDDVFAYVQGSIDAGGSDSAYLIKETKWFMPHGDMRKDIAAATLRGAATKAAYYLRQDRVLVGA